MKTTPVMRIDDTVVVRMTHTEVIDLVERRAAEPSGAPLALCSANLDHLHHFRPGRHRRPVYVLPELPELALPEEPLPELPLSDDPLPEAPPPSWPPSPATSSSATATTSRP